MPVMKDPTIRVNYKKIDGGYVAQCANKPQFIVQVEKKNEIEAKIKDMIEGYVIAFPEERNIVLPDGTTKFKVELHQSMAQGAVTLSGPENQARLNVDLL